MHMKHYRNIEKREYLSYDNTEPRINHRSLLLGLLVLFGLLRRLLLNRRLAGVLDLDGSLVLQLRHVLARSRDAQYSIRREVRAHLTEVALLWDHVLAYELTRDKSVLVLLLLVLGLDDDVFVNDLDIDLLRLELLHVQDDLELVLVGLHGRSSAVGASRQIVGPLAKIQHRISHGIAIARWQDDEVVENSRAQQLLLLQSQSKVLIEDSVGAVKILPPVGEQQRYERHLRFFLSWVFCDDQKIIRWLRNFFSLQVVEN